MKKDKGKKKKKAGKDKKKKKAGKVGFNYPEKGELLYQIMNLNDLDADKMLLTPIRIDMHTAIRIDMHIVKDAIIRIQKYLYG